LTQRKKYDILIIEIKKGELEMSGVYIVYHTEDAGIFWIFINENDAQALLKELNQNSNEYDMTYEHIL
jgi:hypothetical protein